MFLSVNKYYILVSLRYRRVLPLIIKPETAAQPSAGLFAALIYGLEVTTEPLHATAVFCTMLRKLQAAARPAWRGGEGEKACFPGSSKGFPAPGQGWGWCSVTGCPMSPVL